MYMPREIKNGASRSTTYGRSASGTVSAARRSADSARTTSPSHCQLVADSIAAAVLVRSYRRNIAFTSSYDAKAQTWNAAAIPMCDGVTCSKE